MQTRKRAKSITFGRKKEEEHEDEVTSAVEPTQPVVEASETTEEKAETVERRSLTDKPQSSELSATLPSTTENEEKPEAPEVTATPANEFITDNQPSAVVEPPTIVEEPKSVEPEVTPTVTEPQLVTSISPDQPTVTDPSADLSPTSPEPSASDSAFTIQSDEKAQAPEVVGEGGKKRFGLYFFLVAFLAFILGLGAMAAVSYGLVNIPFLKIPANIQLPALPGLKPTPTAAPTTAPVVVAPTEKPVDLTAYTISVLNGSGVVGKAAEVKTSLTTAGFKVGTTGNADKSDYTKTVISAKKSVDKDYLTKLQDELQKTYTLDAVSTAPDSDTADVTVTIGQPTAK